MVLEDEEKIKKALEPQLIEYKVMKNFWDKNWNATQRYYEIKKGEQLKDLDIHAQKNITKEGTFFKFNIRLEMYISVKFRQKFTFVGVKWPKSNLLAEERVIQVLDPNFYDYKRRFTRIYYLPEAPAPMSEDAYQIYVQKTEKSEKFTNSEIFSYAKKLFEAWYSKSLYGYSKSWTDLSSDEFIYENWLSQFKGFNQNKLCEKNKISEFLDLKELGKMFLKEKAEELLKIEKPNFFIVIRVPLLVVGSNSCCILDYSKKNGLLENYKAMNWVKCQNYFFPINKDQVRFGFYFIPLKNISQFIDEFDRYTQTWLKYFFKKEELNRDIWWTTLIGTHLKDFERNYHQLISKRKREE